MAADRPEPSPLSDTLPVGTRIRDQVVQEFLRSLPEGRLYRVRHAQTGAEAMLQEYLPESCARRVGQGIALIPGRGPEFRAGMQRFLLRAQQLKSLNHPSLPVFSDLMPSHGTAFAVLPLMTVRTLAEVVEAEGGRLPLAQIWPWLNTCCDVAQWLHEQGRIHGALEPGAVWVLDDHRLLLPPPELEEGYRPPSPWVALEQTVLASSGTPRGPWTDVYGIGALATFMLTGQGPKSAARRTVPAPARPASGSSGTVWADSRGGGLDPIPGVLKAAIRVSLMPNPRERPQDIGQFKAMLGLAEQLSVSPGGDTRDTVPDPLHAELPAEPVPAWLASAAASAPPRRPVPVTWKETLPPVAQTQPPLPSTPQDPSWQPRPEERAPDSVPVEGLDSLPPGLTARQERLQAPRRQRWATVAMVASVVALIGLWALWRGQAGSVSGPQLAGVPAAVPAEPQASFDRLVRESPTAAGVPAASGSVATVIDAPARAWPDGPASAPTTAAVPAEAAPQPPAVAVRPPAAPGTPTTSAGPTSTAAAPVPPVNPPATSLGADAAAPTRVAVVRPPAEGVPAPKPTPAAASAAITATGVPSASASAPARSARAASAPARTAALPSTGGPTAASPTTASAATRQRCSQALVEQSLGLGTANVDKYCR